MSRIRTVVLTNILAPYRIAFFNALAEHPAVDLHVLYVAEQEANRAWQTYREEIRYRWRILPGWHVPWGRTTLHFNIGLGREFRRLMPEVVVIGTDILGTPASWRALYCGRRIGARLIRFEGQHPAGLRTGGMKGWMRRRFFARMDAFFVYSTLTRDYLRHIGIEEQRIVVGYNVGDLEAFVRASQFPPPCPEGVMINGQKPAVVFLFCGRLAPEKNVLALVEALHGFHWPDALLVILGDGPLRATVRDRSHRLRIPVLMPGFVQKEHVTPFFAHADVFVLPTLRDAASIVVSEALASGLFTIGSPFDGSAVNFIRSGENGLLIDPRDRGALLHALLRAYELKKSGRLNKEAIRKSVEGFSVRDYANRLAELVIRVKQGRLPPTNDSSA